MTHQTKRWPTASKIEGQKKESERVYSNFSSTDQGRARQLVCHVNPDHPKYEENMKLIRQAPLVKDAYERLDKERDALLFMSRWEKFKWIFSK